jgi:hypothetical protein
MKKMVLCLLFLSVVAPVALYATVDTVTVPNDYNVGTINTVIQGDTLPSGARTNPDRVYKLLRGGFYQLNGTMVFNPGTTIKIIGEDAPATGKDLGMPQIIESPVVGGYYIYNIQSYGNLIMKNVWIVYAYTDGTQDWTCLQFEQNNLPQAIGDFENCIFDCTRAVAVTTNRTGFVGRFRNCIFRNSVDPSQWWAGRMCCTISASASIDSVGAENCSFENQAFSFQTDYTPPKRVWFNHNTFINITKFAFKFYYMTHLVCTNNIFVNCHFTGERYADRVGQDPDNLLWGTTLDIDTLPSSVNYNNVVENDRVVVFYNNSNYTQPEFAAWYQTYNDTVTSGNRGKIFAEPMMNDRTLDMFTWHPYMKMGNTYDETDPGFIKTPTVMDSIRAFLKAKYQVGGNVWWGTPIDSVLRGVWPLPENLAYTNSTLKTAGMGNLPLGDLFHWFPAQYATWNAQRQAENVAIYNIAPPPPGNAGVTGVNKSELVPGVFALEQNYPNPFNPTSTITYSIAKKGNVELKVFNVLGQEVQTLFSGVQSAGSHTITFNGSRLASGIYFYRLNSDNQSITKKLVMMK